MKAISDTSQLLGVTETEPIDFFVYADQQAFYQALGPGTRENVGGQANADIRTLFALITPDQIDADWGITSPELSDRDAANPKRAEIPEGARPRWPMRT